MRRDHRCAGVSGVLLVSDQPVLRLGVMRLFENEQDFEVLGEASDPCEAVQQTTALHPDLIVLALPLGGELHLDLLQQLKAAHPPIRALVGTRVSDPSLTSRIVRCGADGCVHWGESVATILGAARAVLDGDLYVGGSAAQLLVRHAVAGRPSAVRGMDSLTDQQTRIFAMIGQGLTTQQIAAKLDVSPRTIESHRKNIKLRLGVPNGFELSRRAFQWWRDHT